MGLAYIILPKFKYKQKYNKFLIPILLIIFLFGKQIFLAFSELSPRLAGYVGSEYDTENYFGALLNFLLTFAIWWFGNDALKKKENKEVNEEVLLYNKIIIISVITTLLTIRVGIFNRFTPYFSIFEIIWIPNVLKLMKNNRQLFKLFFIIVLLSYWIIIMVFRPEWYGAVPYEMITF